jgi:CRISPR-associated endonuclease/helicase Cas3
MLRHEIYQETKRRARAIYALPFLSIIDQNAKVIQEALELKHGWQTGMMVTHHHLSKLEYYDTDAGKESYSSAESELIIEGWHSEVIITNFVQFLETIINTSASYLRKLHNIPGSIVILDEVQSIDYKHWLLVHDCLKFLAEEFDTRVILMTATQPLIFNKVNKEIFELVDPDYQRFHRERVQLKLDLKNGISLVVL